MEHAANQNKVTTAPKKQGKQGTFFGKKGESPLFAPAFIQPRLTIGPVDDPYEREADAMADKVMRMSDTEMLQTKPSPVSIQRKCAHCEEEEKLQRKASVDADAPAISSAVQETLQSTGHSLDGGTRSFMEERFGYDFAGVQIHNDSPAHHSSADINALAYTHGQHIVFAAGQYQPDTNTGKQLLAHELTHVVQQNGSQKSILQRKTPTDDPSSKGNGSCDAVETNSVDKTGSALKFETSSSNVSSKTSQDTLNLFTKTWQQNGSKNEVLVNGYASLQGPADTESRQAMNLGFSCDRANSVKADLIAKGVTAALITTIAHGETSEFGSFEENRRVQFKEKIAAPPKPSAQDPNFHVISVNAITTPDGKNNSENGFIILRHGTFEINAEVSAFSPQPSDFDDWQLGIVQMAGSFQRACYKFPPAKQNPNNTHKDDVFVEGSQTKAPNFLMPDRANEFPPPIFLDNDVRGGSDLAGLHHGQSLITLKLRAVDMPTIKNLPANAVADKDIMNKHPEADGAEINKIIRFNIFITHVIGRQKSSGRIIPLHVVGWFLLYSGDFNQPGSTLGIEISNQVNIFEKSSVDRPSAPTDGLPIVDGQAINFLPKEFSWQKNCI
ncbi:MAG TPA: DUF4157 domain-containing protein [Puia sp.]|nr:DUF4157 domain-containing protein [Puia sp.]